MAPSPAPQASKDKPKRKGAGRADGGYKIAGTVLPWDPDIDLNRPTPTPLFPAQVAAFRALRARIHEGPFYTILDSDARIGKKTAKTAAANVDPFEAMPTYSQKYMKKRRRLPKLSAMPYVLKYFPKELWPTLDPKNHKSSNINGQSKVIPKRKERQENGETAQETAGDRSGDEDMRDRDPEEEAMEEPVENEFDEDDDDGGDYNAEQYFDDGGDDLGDDLDGGDGGDYF
ncbi:MAG: hypothetical protein LQ338_002514 [Usnochroma carphineum]|nr:MAG: hypothetical protein LQ338_002514 [Usnochroma carphineum]